MMIPSFFACITFISLCCVIPGYGQSIEVDGDGRLHIVAVFNSEFALDDTTLTETLADGNTVVAATFDEAGTLLWARPIKKGVSDVNLAVDAMGDTYIGGYLADSVQFEPGLPFVQGGFVSKYDQEGKIQWVNTDVPFIVVNLDVDTQRQTWVLTFFFELNYIAKLDSNGATVWSRNSGSLLGRAIKGVGNGRAMYTGNYLLDIFVGQIDAQGEEVWTFRTDGGYFGGSTLGLDEAGNSYVSGPLSSTAQFSESILLDQANGFVAKFDPQGGVLWANPIEMRHFREPVLALDAQGNVHVSLYVDQYQEPENPGLLLRGYRPNGTLIYTKFLEGLLGDDDNNRNYFTAADGFLYFIGHTASPAALEGVTTLFYNGDLIIGKVALSTLVSNTSEPETPARTLLEANFPNPFRSSTTIDFSLSSPAKVDLRVYDLLGREVATVFRGPQAAGRHTAHFDAGALPAGVYFYRLRIDGATQTRMMTLLR